MDGDVVTWFLPVPQCSECGSQTIRHDGTHPNGDGTKTRRYRCLDCGARFRVAIEYVPTFSKYEQFPE